MPKLTRLQTEELYYKMYMDNIDALPFEMRWIKVMDLYKSPYSTTPWVDSGDPYLTEHAKKRIALGKDVIENGTYWPLIGYEEDGKIYISEGVHRLEGVKLTISEGFCDKDFEMLTILVPWDVAYRARSEEQKRQCKRPLDGPIIAIPFYGDIRMATRYIDLYKLINERTPEVFDDDIIYFKPTTEWECFRAYQVATVFLRDSFHKYKDDNGGIKPNPILNNKQEWGAWLDAGKRKNGGNRST